MKKLCLTFVFILLAVPFLSQEAFSATKKKKKQKATPTPSVSSAQTVAPTPAPPVVQRNHGIPREKLSVAYEYAKSLYAARNFDKAKEIFKKIVLVSTDSDLNANSLYLYSQCSFRTEDYEACVRALTILAKRWPSTPLITSGYVTRFCSSLITEVANLQTNWDYYRFKERNNEDGTPLWKESIPPGFKIKRINFKLGFGLYRVLKIIQPTGPQTLDAKNKLNYMLNAPITMIWVDEKAPPNKWGHPGDFMSYFSKVEKKDFSNVICERMFFDWKTEKLYLYLDMYDDVRNLKPRFIAKTKQPDEAEAPAAPSTVGQTAPLVPGVNATAILPQQDPTIVLTLYKLFLVSGYNPYEDSYTSTIESSPSDLNL